MPVSNRLRRPAFTLVELLVVIAIIGVLVALLLPAVQAARETARRTQCTNQLKQFVIAGLNHENAIKHFPTGGWGWDWVGDADRGFGRSQPGGWIYNVLPFMEQQAKHDMPRDGMANVMTDPQLDGARRMLVDPIGILYCPSRRSGQFFNKGHVARFANNSAVNTADTRDYVGRSDYAANAGDFAIGGGAGGPKNLDVDGWKDWWVAADGLGSINRDNVDYKNVPEGSELSGISFERSSVAIRNVADGTSKTYFAGEKYLDPLGYENGKDTGDNETWCTGHNNDNFRTTAFPPLQDTPGLENGNIFGSAHPTGWNVAWCDGHVEYLSFDIDPLIHKYNGNRSDGNTASGQ
jgi:prepilin-type N-terminal cleavage/methylation domain-containing protein/prepilin-type processing-associated H-X9-DG protein